MFRQLNKETVQKSYFHLWTSYEVLVNTKNSSVKTNRKNLNTELQELIRKKIKIANLTRDSGLDSDNMLLLLMHKVSALVPQSAQQVTQPSSSVKLNPSSLWSLCWVGISLKNVVLSGDSVNSAEKLDIRKASSKIPESYANNMTWTSQERNQPTFYETNRRYKSKPKYFKSNGLLATIRIDTKQGRKYVNPQFNWNQVRLQIDTTLEITIFSVPPAGLLKWNPN